MPKRISATMKAVHKQESLDRLRKALTNGMTVYDAEVARAKSGMSARYKFFIPLKDEYNGKEDLSIRDITLDVAQVTDSKYDRETGTVRIDGCGLNRPQHLLDSVAYALKDEDAPYGSFRLKQRSL